ncbi:hypothetical protein VHEMI01266 [[Torrubiella] hemipterigena]|uniref:Uncharacterized protein n=1 Tax=[Torrubiella] hemipterigena TaxID=1531966 RepID=A0A0A1SSM1_9HYPO|nr:hypothetical protein VHEMI01266 [[Torrubiella] hemipterigena]
MKATPLFAPLALAAIANANILLPQRNAAPIAIVDRAPQHDDSAWQDPQGKNRGQSGVLVSTDTTAYSRGPLASPVSITSALPVTGTPAGEGPLPTLPKLSSDTRTNPGGAPQTSEPGSFVVQTTMPTNTKPAASSNGAGGSSAAASSSAPAAASSSAAAVAQRGPVVAVAAIGMAAAALVL